MAEPRLLRTENLPLADIAIPARLRPIGDGDVVEMMESMGELGLLTAIGVRRTPEGPALIYGAHRLEAARRLGWDAIRADVWEMGARHARLAECEENLRRGDLSLLELAIHLAERKAIYEQLHPETKAGTAAALARWSETMQRTHVSFASNVAERRGITPRHVRRLTRIGANLDRAAADDLRRVGRQPTHRELTSLAELTPEQQRAAAALWAEGKAKNGRQAALMAQGEPVGEKTIPRAEEDMTRLAMAWERSSKAGRDQFLGWLRDLGYLL